MSFWREEKTPDGWSYGYGEYKKSLVDMVNIPAYKKVITGTTPLEILKNTIITAAAAEGRERVIQLARGLDKYTAMPTYYLWAMKWGSSPTDSSKKFVGGEWNALAGGKDALLAWWPTFDTCMVNSGRTAEACIAQSWTWPTIQTPKQIVNALDSGSGMTLPIVIIAGAVLAYLLG